MEVELRRRGRNRREMPDQLIVNGNIPEEMFVRAALSITNSMEIGVAMGRRSGELL
jgi:hypothetical protein